MLKADLRRLFRTRSLYVCLILMVSIIIITSISMNILTQKGDLFEITYAVEGLNQGTKSDMQKIRAEADVLNNLDSPFMKGMRQKLRSYISFEILFKIPFVSSLFLMLAPLVVVLYSSKDYATGYIKNYLILPQAKTKWLVSKMLILPVIMATFYLGAFISSAIGTLILKNPFPEDFSEIFAYIAKISLPIFSFTLFTLFLTVALQNKTAALIISLPLSFNMQALAYILIDSAGFLPIKLRDWAFISKTKELSMSGVFPENLIAVSIAIATISLILSFVMMNKRDLKV
ncbi:MAG: ABC transporter permease subunit [Eubacteriales bacterium]|nr:ABC transporter permease subunit [Eubacteriales bacterium]